MEDTPKCNSRLRCKCNVNEEKRTQILNCTSAARKQTRAIYTRKMLRKVPMTKMVQRLLWSCLFMKFFFAAVAVVENPLNATKDASGVFCYNGTSYIPIDTSWTTSCITYRCTRNGIQTDNMTYAPCDFLSQGPGKLLNCRSAIVESEDGCCQGIVCQEPSELVPDSGSWCSAGWNNLGLTRTGRRGNLQCIRYSQSRRAFYDAAQDCRKQRAALINLHNLNNYIDVFIGLRRYMESVGNEFWTGLSSEGTKFYWDDLVAPIDHVYYDACGTVGNTDYGWDCGQPDGNGTCAKARFVNDIVKDKIILSSTPCDQQLHYACVKDSSSHLTRVSKTSEACPKDWLLNPRTTKCYKFFNDRQSAFRAVSSCQDVNATLSSVSDRDQLLAILSSLPDTTMSVPKETHGGICLPGVRSNCLQPNFSLPIWFMNTTNDQWYCKIVQNLKLPWINPNLNLDNGNFSSCYRKLPYICEKRLSDQQDSLEITTLGNGSVKHLACKAKRNLSEDDYCGWRADGLYYRSGCMLSVQVYERTAYDCFITDLTSGKRIFSPLIITAKGETTQESLRLTAIIKMPTELLNACRIPTESSNIRSLALQLFLENTSYTTSRNNNNRLSENFSWVTCWTSQSTATLIYALKVPYADRVRSKRDTENRRNSSDFINSNQSATDELSDILEQELTDYWIRTKGGAFVTDTAENLEVKYISVKNLHFCKTHMLLTKELGVVTVPRTAIGKWFNVSMCLSTVRPIISMYCRPQFATGAFWETFIQNECPDALSLAEKRLKLLLVNFTTNVSIIWHLSEALNVVAEANNESGVTVAMIVDTANLVKEALSILTESHFANTESAKLAYRSIPAIVDQVMHAPEESLWQAEAIASSSTTLMKAIDVASEKLLETVPIGNTTRLIYGNVALEVSRDPNLEGIGVLSSQAFSQESLVHLRSDHHVTGADYVAQIVAWLREGENSSKRFTLYRNAKLFKGRLQIPATDIILSANVEGMQESFVTSDFIRAKFENLKGVNSQSVECGFWSNIERDWSTEGCRKVYSDEVSTLCYCNHTTSFAILMGAKPQEQAHYQALSWITLLGLGISIAALLLVLVTFLMFKAMRQTLSQKVLFNLSLAILLLDVAFVAGSQSTKNKSACMVIAILLHYLLLSSFAWMAVEAIHQYFRFVKVIGTYIPRFIIKAAIPAWGLPAVIIGIILAKDYQLYIRFDNVCWVQGPVLYYGVLLPVALVLAFNFTVFAIILRSLLGQKNSHLRSNQNEIHLVKLHLRAAVALLVLMGLTWIFGFLTFQGAGVFDLVSQYLFCIFNSIQGLLIFVFHCVREKNMINFWKRLFRCGQKVPKVEEFSTTGTSDREHTVQMTSNKRAADSSVYSCESNT